MATNRRVLRQAEKEYRRDGTLSVDTYALLTGRGFEADALIAQWETGITEEDKPNE